MDYKYWIYQNGEAKVFMADSASILNKLPTTTEYGDPAYALFEDNAKPVAAGTILICADDGSAFILGSNGQWNSL